VALECDGFCLSGPFHFNKNKGDQGDKTEGIFDGAAANMKSVILKGSGRFEGIKGTQRAKGKYLPPEKGELGVNVNKRYGEGSFIYTLPGKFFAEGRRRLMDGRVRNGPAQGIIVIPAATAIRW
jgi:hypothetical protein